jgi:hypothetical protein
MIIPNQLIKPIITGIISPHGITDFIHAKKFGLLKELYHVNLSIISAGSFLNLLHLDNVVNIVFITSSIIHFRNDMPIIQHNYINSKLNTNQLQLLLSSLMVGSLYVVPHDFFILYMIFIHTPNHYKMALPYIQERLLETVLLVVGLGMFLTYISCSNYPIIDLSNDNLIDCNSMLYNFIKTVIISHIVYEELYIFNEYRNNTNSTNSTNNTNITNKIENNNTDG